MSDSEESSIKDKVVSFLISKNGDPATFFNIRVKVGLFLTSKKLENLLTQLKDENKILKKEVYFCKQWKTAYFAPDFEKEANAWEQKTTKAGNILRDKGAEIAAPVFSASPDTLDAVFENLNKRFPSQKDFRKTFYHLENELAVECGESHFPIGVENKIEELAQAMIGMFMIFKSEAKSDADVSALFDNEKGVMECAVAELTDVWEQIYPIYPAYYSGLSNSDKRLRACMFLDELSKRYNGKRTPGATESNAKLLSELAMNKANEKCKLSLRIVFPPDFLDTLVKKVLEKTSEEFQECMTKYMAIPYRLKIGLNYTETEGSLVQRAVDSLGDISVDAMWSDMSTCLLTVVVATDPKTKIKATLKEDALKEWESRYGYKIWRATPLLSRELNKKFKLAGNGKLDNATLGRSLDKFVAFYNPQIDRLPSEFLLSYRKKIDSLTADAK